MVLTPTSKELKKLKDAREVEDNNASKYLIFTTFSKAFTSEKKALELVSKNPKSIFVRVMMKLHPIVAEDLDFGYWVENDLQEGPNVIFNIYNVFEISEIEEKSMTILYGSLAHVVCKREKERNSRLNPHQLNLLRNYDYLEDIISRINSQATILQMSGYFQDSLEVYNQKLSVIRKSQASQELLDEHTIQLGDAYRINEDFDKAEKELLSIKEGKGKLRANVHLAELYFKSKDKDKLEKIIKEI
jgi:tetratricopeptide (TPR) repeat protein